MLKSKLKFLLFNHGYNKLWKKMYNKIIGNFNELPEFFKFPKVHAFIRSFSIFNAKSAGL